MSYISETGQRQELLNVKGRVSLVILLVPVCLCGLSYALMMSWGQVFKMQPSGDEFFECRLELLNVIVQDCCEAFKRSSYLKRDHGFYRFGQMLDFLHRLLRRIVQRDNLSEERDWEALRQYEFTSTKFLDVPSFKDKTEF